MFKIARGPDQECTPPFITAFVPDVQILPLIFLLGLKLADSMTMKRDLEIAREVP